MNRSTATKGIAHTVARCDIYLIFHFATLRRVMMMMIMNLKVEQMCSKYNETGMYVAKMLFCP